MLESEEQEMTNCANKSCARGPKGKRAKARKGGLYCSDTCATYVRVRRLRARLKAGIRLKRCAACDGTGFMKATFEDLKREKMRGDL